MKKAYIFGCSHAAGSEMALEPGLDLQTHEEINEYEANNSYPALIARDLGFLPMNYAVAGGSNDCMFRLFLENLSGMEDGDIVIACWTGAGRTEVYSADDQAWVQITPGTKDTLTHLSNYIPWLLENAGALLAGRPSSVAKNHQIFKNFSQAWLEVFEKPLGELNKTKNIIAVNSLAAGKGIKVINIDSFWALDSRQYPSCRDTYFWPVTKTFTIWARDHQAVYTSRQHYFRPTHRSFADHVLSEIDKNGPFAR